MLTTVPAKTNKRC